ncbi:MAG: endonuclease domain-containing protein [Roseivirga sp.]|nr:endonuclease domain-containing protein [Roseivirga sp.]
MHAGASARIFQLARKLRDNMTIPEKRLWEFLKSRPNGFKFRRQHPCGEYILDFYCHEKRLSIEVDGESHNKANQVEKDATRTDFLRQIGIKELRFQNEDVLNQLERIVSAITLELCEGSLQGKQGRALEENKEK